MRKMTFAAAKLAFLSLRSQVSKDSRNISKKEINGKDTPRNTVFLSITNPGAMSWYALPSGFV
jgi:hypothetical protein